ncbi:MAG: hypothetical protein EBR30_07770 [Cytophagia bacterium]|nr:hypothetical protein [Cytophagia bacterium]
MKFSEGIHFTTEALPVIQHRCHIQKWLFWLKIKSKEPSKQECDQPAPCMLSGATIKRLVTFYSQQMESRPLLLRMYHQRKDSSWVGYLLIISGSQIIIVPAR